MPGLKPQRQKRCSLSPERLNGPLQLQLASNAVNTIVEVWTKHKKHRGADQLNLIFEVNLGRVGSQLPEKIEK